MLEINYFIFMVNNKKKRYYIKINFFPGEPLFRIKEKSNCCTRNLLPGEMRPFKLEMTDILS
jgi:hypothetical protein